MTRVSITTLMAVSLVWPMSAAWSSGQSDAVRRLMDDGRNDVAQARCERLNAHFSDTPRGLREVCAEAMFEAALDVNTVGTWIRFQQEWSGTPYARSARDQEAAAALRDLGNDSEDYRYAQFMSDYRDTKYANAASQMLADARFRTVETGAEAVALVREHPNHPLSPILIERFLTSFVHMEMKGDTIEITPVEGVTLPGPPPQGRWAAQISEESYLNWGDAAETYLKEIGITSRFIERAGREGFPPCQETGVDWTLGILVQIGDGKSFFPNAGVESCKGRPWPTFTVYKDGRLSALSVGPGSQLHFPAASEDNSFHWGQTEQETTRIWSPGIAGDPIMVGTVIGQPVGNLFLLTPMTGGMPWYVNQGPPPDALPIPIEARSSQLPKGWQLIGPDGPMAAGQTSTEPVNAQSSSLAGVPWEIPEGEVRVMSNLVQQVTKLSQKNPVFNQARGGALPILTGATGPLGAQVVETKMLDNANAGAVGRQLSRAGIPLQVERAWEANLGGSGPPEVIFEGTAGGQRIKGVLDPMADRSTFRAFVWLRDARAQAGTEDMLAFAYEGATYFIWRGNQDNTPYTEAIHFEDIGLIREFR